MDAKVRGYHAVRVRFLNQVYDAVGGRQNNHYTIHSIAANMGLDAVA